MVFESFTERAQTLLMKIKMRGLLVYSMFQIRVNALVLCDCATLGCTVIVNCRVAVIVGCCMTADVGVSIHCQVKEIWPHVDGQHAYIRS